MLGVKFRILRAFNFKLSLCEYYHIASDGNINDARLWRMRMTSRRCWVVHIWGELYRGRLEIPAAEKANSRPQRMSLFYTTADAMVVHTCTIISEAIIRVAYWQIILEENSLFSILWFSSHSVPQNIFYSKFVNPTSFPNKLKKKSIVHFVW